MALQPPIVESELREWLLDAGLAVDDATIARLLVRLQPMRVRLRGAGLAQLESALRGHAMAAGWRPTRDAPAPGPAPAAGRSPMPRVAIPLFPEIPAVPTPAPFIRGGNWGKRLFLLYVTAVTGFFALSMLMSTTPGASIVFVAIALVFLFVAVTGRGLSGGDDPDAAPRSWRDRAAGAVLYVFGGGIVLGAIGLLIQGLALVRGGPRAFSLSHSFSLLGMIGVGLTVRRAVQYWREHYD